MCKMGFLPSIRIAQRTVTTQFIDDEGDSLFDQILTGDKTWTHHWTPKSKSLHMVWKGKNKVAQKNAKVVELSGKVMAIGLGITRVSCKFTTCPVGPPLRLQAIVKCQKNLEEQSRTKVGVS